MGPTIPNAFALRPLPVGDRRPQNLSDFILRVNAERGGFRNVTTEKMREESEAEVNGDTEANDGDTLMADTDDQEHAIQISPDDFAKAVAAVYERTGFVPRAPAPTSAPQGASRGQE